MLARYCPRLKETIKNAREKIIVFFLGRLTGPTKDGWIVSFECFGKIDPPSLFQNSSVEFRIKYNIWKMELLEKKCGGNS